MRVAVRELKSKLPHLQPFALAGGVIGVTSHYPPLAGFPLVDGAS